MSPRGARLAAHCTVGILVVLGASVPVAHASEDTDPGPHDVVVLGLSDDDGVPTDLATPFVDLRAGSAVTTPELDVPEFSVAAVTWDGPTAPDEEISLRVKAGGEWAPWSVLEPDAGEASDIGGTEPYVVGAATAVQARVTGGDGVLPGRLELHLIPAQPGEPLRAVTTADAVGNLARNTGAEPAAAGSSTTAHSSSAATPRVISRAGWGADESMMSWTPRYDELDAAVVHHTAGTNSYTAAQSPGIVRGIYHYHAVTRGWGDIGYHFLVDKYGQIFEGRAGTLAGPDGRVPEAAHARGFNRGSLGISVLGNYAGMAAPDLALDTMAEVVAWRFADAGIDVREPSDFVSPGTAARPAGERLARVFAHRDVGDTTCPGDDMYRRIPALLDDVADRVERLGVRPTSFHLRNRAEGGTADVSFELGRVADEVYVGDWDGSGVDTLALRRGKVFHFYSALDGGAADRVVSYGRPDDTVLVGDWDGDGVDTLAVRRGEEYFVKNSVSGGEADVVISYGRVGDIVLVGDWNADRSDTFAVRRGSEYHVRNSMRGGTADVVFRYGRPTDEVLVGDWDGDDSDTLAVRRGRTYYPANALEGGRADAEFVYGRATDDALVGDWNGNGADGVGVRRVG